MDRQAHWDRIYTGKTPEGLPWHTPHLSVSLEVITSLGVARTGGIIDVGGGASTLARDLLDAGFERITILDVSPVALSMAAGLLGERAERVARIRGDATTVPLPPAAFAVWHDRAVFHFLVDPSDRRAYVSAAERSLAPEGHVIVSGFAPTGPARCSGLDVVRSSSEEIAREFGPGFVLIDAIERTHVTPAGVAQDFITFVLRRPFPSRTRNPLV